MVANCRERRHTYSVTYTMYNEAHKGLGVVVHDTLIALYMQFGHHCSFKSSDAACDLCMYNA